MNQLLIFDHNYDKSGGAVYSISTTITTSMLANKAAPMTKVFGGKHGWYVKGVCYVERLGVLFVLLIVDPVLTSNEQHAEELPERDAEASSKQQADDEQKQNAKHIQKHQL